MLSETPTRKQTIFPFLLAGLVDNLFDLMETQDPFPSPHRTNGQPAIERLVLLYVRMFKKLNLCMHSQPAQMRETSNDNKKVDVITDTHTFQSQTPQSLSQCYIRKLYECYFSNQTNIFFGFP